MSVRRLADDSIQPQAFAFNEDNARWAEATIRKYPEGRQQSAVIPLLMRVQDQEGWVTKPALEYVANTLKMPMIRVLEVATFYTQFQLKPVGTRAHVQVCGTTPCMLRGAEKLKDVCREKIHPEPFHTNADGTMSWEEVECLGACVNAPMVLVFDDTYEDLTPERFAEMLDLFEAGRGGEIVPGPQNGRHQSVPAGGLTTLTGDYDDLIDKQPKSQSSSRSGGAANGAPAQGSGAGRTVSTPPSEAGRPNSEAEETDPSISAKGKASNGNADHSQESHKSDELAAEGHRPGSGKTGGAREGGTDQAERDAAETRHATGDAPASAAASTGGGRSAAEAAAEKAVVPDVSRPDDQGGAQDRRKPGAKAEASRDAGIDETEGQRRGTDDEVSGPGAADVFPSKENPREAGSSEAFDAETADRGAGAKPQTLLDAPQGEPDDLKEIKGIGPVIEKKLNDLGVHHFWQIAGWQEPELLWIDDYLNFRGRAVREGWIDQAKALQDGSADGTSA